MQQQLYSVSADSSLNLESHVNASSEWTGDETTRWLMIELAESDDVAEILSSFKLDPLILEALSEEHAGPRMVCCPGALLMSVPIYRVASGPLDYLILLSLPTTLITLAPDSATGLHRMPSELNHRLPEPTVPALLYLIFDLLGDLSMEPFFECRQNIARLSEQLEDDPGSFDLSDLLANKQTVNRLIATLEEQLFCINTYIKITTHELSGSRTQDLFRDLVGTGTLAQHARLRLESRLKDLHQHYLLTLQDTTNRRLNVLTVLSTLYLPPTLIAGIFGMNFQDIPVVQMEYGYFIVLAIMLSMVLGQLVFFYWRGWFR